MRYELWDLETTNLWGSYPSEEAALAEVRRAVDEFGEEAVELWGMNRVDKTGGSLAGHRLAERARGVVLA